MMRFLTKWAELHHNLVLPLLVANVILLHKLCILMRLHLVVLRSEELLLIDHPTAFRLAEHLEVCILHIRGQRCGRSCLSSLLSEGTPG